MKNFQTISIAVNEKHRIFTVIIVSLLTIASVMLLQQSSFVSAQNCSDVDRSIGSGDFQMSILEEDNYNVWLRIASPASDAKVNLKINDGCHEEAGRDGLDRNELTWINRYSNGSEITANLQEGVSAFELVGVTERLEVDQILLVSDGCVPEGNGDNCIKEDEGAPVVSIVDPREGQTISGDLDLHAIVTDEDTELTVRFIIDNELYSNGDKNNMSEWFIQIETAELSNGAHDLVVEAEDSSGNVGRSSVNFNVDNQPDTPPPPTGNGDTVQLLPTDDTFARSDKPNNTNTNSTLHTDDRPEKIIYLRYELPANFVVSNAKLALFAIDGSDNGGTIRTSGSEWRENTLTWNNRPAVDSAVVAEIGSVQDDTWYEVDVTSGIGSDDKVVTFVISSSSNDRARYNSKEKESSETGPFLVLEGSSTTGEDDGGGDDPGDPNPEPQPDPDPQNYTLVVTEDAFARSDQPNETARTNTLHTDSSPEKIAYLKFDASEIVGKTIDSASLRIYSLRDVDDGGEIRTSSVSTWSEATLNWNNRPPVSSSVLGDIGAVAEDRWYEIDISTLDIPDNGVVTIAITNPSNVNGRFQSKDKESGNFSAELRISAR